MAGGDAIPGLYADGDDHGRGAGADVAGGLRAEAIGVPLDLDPQPHLGRVVEEAQCALADLKASGVSVARITAPVVLVATILAVVLVEFNNTIRVDLPCEYCAVKFVCLNVFAVRTEFPEMVYFRIYSQVTNYLSCFS